jgi:hypothetical protein
VDPYSYSNPEIVFADSNGSPFVRFDNSNMYINGNIIFGSQTNIPMWLLADNVLNKCPCGTDYENELEGNVLIDGDLTVNGHLCAKSIVNTLVTQSLQLRSGPAQWDFAISNAYTSNPQLVVGTPNGDFVSFFQGGNMNIPSDLLVNGTSVVGGNLAVNGIVRVDGNLTLANASNPLGLSTWSNYVDENCNLVFQSSHGTRVEFTEMFTPELLNFTGKHRCGWLDKENKLNTRPFPKNRDIGKIVYSTGSYFDLDGNSEISIDEALPIVALCNRSYDPRAFGVIGGVEKEGRFRIGNLSFLKEGQEPRVIVQSQGEGAIWVTNYGGALFNGDYVASSPIKGYGMKQGRGFSTMKHNYTVAKITMDCNFKAMEKTVLYKGRRYKIALVGCVYQF